MHRPHVHRRRGRAFRLAVIAHSTLRSMLLRTKHYVTDCRLVATHVLSADVRYRWRPLPSACTRDEKLHTHPETMNFAFSMFVAFTAFYLYFVSGLLLLPLRVCRRLHHNNGFLFAISRFLELIWFFYCLTCHTNWHRYFTSFFFSFSLTTTAYSSVCRHILQYFLFFSVVMSNGMQIIKAKGNEIF